ncbi:DUF2254 domain-containing protein [Brevibacterium casei]|nr:DUF2254 domain-containing protein [Brevibacterium casei]
MRRHIRPTTMWDVPPRLLIAAVVLGLLTPLVDRGLAQVFSPYPDLDSGGVASALGIISGAMVTLAGLAFAALTTPMSLGITTMSVRLAPLLQSDRVVQWALGSFVATFVYSAAHRPEHRPRRGQLQTVDGHRRSRPRHPRLRGDVPRLRRARVHTAQLRGGARADSPVTGGKALRFSPDRFHTHAVAVSERSVPDGHLVRRRHYGSGGDALLAVNTPRLLDFEDAWGCTIELVPTVGTPVPVHTLLFRTSEALTSRQEAELEKAVAFGDIESPENGPFGAIRTISDIALKALSPAVNDPSRAVQALDQIEAILIRLSPMIDAQEKELASRPDASVRATGRALGRVRRRRHRRDPPVRNHLDPDPAPPARALRRPRLALPRIPTGGTERTCGRPRPGHRPVVGGPARSSALNRRRPRGHRRGRTVLSRRLGEGATRAPTSASSPTPCTSASTAAASTPRG